MRDRERGRSASTQSRLTLAGGPHAGDGRTSGLIVTQKSKLATVAMSATKAAPTSQSRGSGPNRTPDLPASSIHDRT